MVLAAVTPVGPTVMKMPFSHAYGFVQHTGLFNEHAYGFVHAVCNEHAYGFVHVYVRKIDVTNMPIIHSTNIIGIGQGIACERDCV